MSALNQFKEFFQAQGVKFSEWEGMVGGSPHRFKILTVGSTHFLFWPQSEVFVEAVKD